jgi:hypothetical protein
MNNNLADAMKSLAAENAATPVPASLEAKVLAAFDVRRTTPSHTRWWFPVTAVALAALSALAVFVAKHPAPHPTIATEAPFIAIPYVAPPAPYERTEMKRMDVPLAALIAAGLEVRASGDGGMVRADVIVGQDGRPLAIRLLKENRL